MKVKNRSESCTVLCENAAEKDEFLKSHVDEGGWAKVRVTGLVGADQGKFLVVIGRNLKTTKPKAKP